MSVNLIFNLINLMFNYHNQHFQQNGPIRHILLILMMTLCFPWSFHYDILALLLSFFSHYIRERYHIDAVQCARNIWCNSVLKPLCWRTIFQNWRSSIFIRIRLSRFQAILWSYLYTIALYSKLCSDIHLLSQMLLENSFKIKFSSSCSIHEEV